jgi:hypothetical protein
MKIALMTGLLAKRDVDVYTGHLGKGKKFTPLCLLASG